MANQNQKYMVTQLYTGPNCDTKQVSTDIFPNYYEAEIFKVTAMMNTLKHYDHVKYDLNDGSLVVESIMGPLHYYKWDITKVTIH